MTSSGRIRRATGADEKKKNRGLTKFRYFDAEAGGVLAASVSDVIRNQFQYVTMAFRLS